MLGVRRARLIDCGSSMDPHIELHRFTLLRSRRTRAMVLLLSAASAQENDAAQHAGPQGCCKFFVDNDSFTVGDHDA